MDGENFATLRMYVWTSTFVYILSIYCIYSTPCTEIVT